MPNFIKSQLWKLIFTKIYKYLNPIARKSYSLNYVHKSQSICYNFFFFISQSAQSFRLWSRFRQKTMKTWNKSEVAFPSYLTPPFFGDPERLRLCNTSPKTFRESDKMDWLVNSERCREDWSFDRLETLEAGNSWLSWEHLGVVQTAS